MIFNVLVFVFVFVFAEVKQIFFCLFLLLLCSNTDMKSRLISALICMINFLEFTELVDGLVPSCGSLPPIKYTCLNGFHCSCTMQYALPCVIYYAW